MSGAALREVVLRRVGEFPDKPTRFGPSWLPREVAEQVGCTRPEVYEVLWALLADGLVHLQPDPQYAASFEYWLWLPTKVGRRVLEGGDWHPEDPEGFLRRLDRQSPTLDPVARQYFAEALGAFRSRCYLATAVMLGVASEAAFGGLAEAYIGSLPPERAASARKDLTGARQSDFHRWEAFRKRINPVREQLPEDLRDRLLLDAVSDLLRITRNDVGHPTGRLIDEDTARTHLLIAATYLGRMTALRDHFAAHTVDADT